MLNIVLQYNTLIILEDDTSYSCQGIVANRFFIFFLFSTGGHLLSRYPKWSLFYDETQPFIMHGMLCHVN